MARLRIEELERPAEMDLDASMAGHVMGAGPVIIAPGYYGYGGVVSVGPNYGYLSAAPPISYGYGPGRFLGYTPFGAGYAAAGAAPLYYVPPTVTYVGW
jgi:hypothetical protein